MICLADRGEKINVRLRVDCCMHALNQNLLLDNRVSCLELLRVCLIEHLSRRHGPMFGQYDGHPSQELAQIVLSSKLRASKTLAMQLRTMLIFFLPHSRAGLASARRLGQCANRAFAISDITAGVSLIIARRSRQS